MSTVPRPVTYVLVGAVGLTMAGAGALAAQFVHSATTSTATVGGVVAESVTDAPAAFENGRLYVSQLGTEKKLPVKGSKAVDKDGDGVPDKP